MSTIVVINNGDTGLEAREAINDNFSELNADKLETADLGDLGVLDTIGTSHIDNDAVTYAKMQNVSATSRILGRITTGAGDVEELTDANLYTILGITASSAELNVLDGIPAGLTATELGFVDGVTSAIQTQLNGKEPTKGSDDNYVTDTQLAIIANTTASFTTTDETKLDYITVTQAVDLDQMEIDIAALANGMIYKGNWDASAGTFPGASVAQTGWFYTVSVGGTVDSVVFNIGDRLIAITDNASTTTYAGNWTALDATDAVTSVNGQTGNVSVGTVTSVALSVPTGLAVTGSPVTTTGTLALALDTGYVIPTQVALDAKAPLISPTFATSVTGSYLTASEMLITDGSKNIVSAPVATYPSLAQLAYVKGVTSAIQTQIDSKQDTLVSGTNIKTINSTSLLGAGDISISGSVADGDKGDITVSASGATWTIDADAVTYAKMQDVSATSRILGRITGGAGIIEELTDANVYTILGITSSATELNYVDGVTSAIQTQLDGKQPLDSDLTTIADLTATTDNFMQAKAGAWASRTIAEVKTDLGLAGTNSGDQTITLTGNVTGSGTGSFATTIAAGVVTEAMQVLADNTTNDFSTTKHGYVPKGTNVGNFLKDDGTWASAGSGSDISVRVYNSTTVSYSGSTLTAMTFDTESYNTDTMHNTGSNTSRITFTTGGKYSVKGVFCSDTNAVVYGGIRLNGSTYIQRAGVGNAGANTANGFTFALDYVFSAADYIELMGTLASTGTAKGTEAGCQIHAHKFA